MTMQYTILHASLPRLLEHDESRIGHMAMHDIVLDTNLSKEMLHFVSKLLESIGGIAHCEHIGASGLKLFVIARIMHQFAIAKGMMQIIKVDA